MIPRYIMGHGDVDGRWIAHLDIEELQRHFWEGMLFLDDHLPGLEHIILKTPASVVQVPPPPLPRYPP